MKPFCVSFLVVFGLLGISKLCGVMPDLTVDDSATTQSEPDKLTAYRMATRFVERRLAAPSTAVWPDVTTRRDHTTGNGRDFRVVSWVDSRNGFGATVRTYFDCELHHIAGDEWMVDNLTLK